MFSSVLSSCSWGRKIFNRYTSRTQFLLYHMNFSKNSSLFQQFITSYAKRLKEIGYMVYIRYNKIKGWIKLCNHESLWRTCLKCKVSLWMANALGFVSGESQVYTCTQLQGLNGGMAIVHQWKSIKQVTAFKVSVMINKSN